MTINNYIEYKSYLTEHELKHAPESMDYHGDFSLIYTGKRISVVGSRKVTPEISLRTSILIRKLIKKGIIIVSTLNEGVDTIAHKSAIIEKGKTIIITDNPVNQDDNKASKSLSKPVKNEFLNVFVSSLNYLSEPLSSDIINHTRALISDAIIIVEASEKSIVVHLVWEALRLGRTVLVLESLIAGNKVSWVEEILNYGAQVLNKNNFDAIIDDIPFLTAKLDYDF